MVRGKLPGRAKTEEGSLFPPFSRMEEEEDGFATGACGSCGCELEGETGETVARRDRIPQLQCSSCGSIFHPDKSQSFMKIVHSIIQGYFPGCLSITEEKYRDIKKKLQPSSSGRASKRRSAQARTSLWLCPRPECGGETHSPPAQSSQSQTPRCGVCGHRAADESDVVWCFTRPQPHPVHRFCSGISKPKLKKRLPAEPFNCFGCRRQGLRPLDGSGEEEQPENDQDMEAGSEDYVMELDPPPVLEPSAPIPEEAADEARFRSICERLGEAELPSGWLLRVRWWEETMSPHVAVLARGKFTSRDAYCLDIQFRLWANCDIALEVSLCS